MPSATRTTLGVHDIIDAFSRPASDDVPMLISAHRGLRWDGVPENSLAAIAAAARMGLLCIEVDIRMTADNHVVVLHDDGLGRVTNVAEHFGRDGYFPSVTTLPWNGVIEHLSLKDEHGAITSEGVLDFAGMLDFITTEGIDMVLFLDVKDKAAIPIAYEIVKSRANAKGVPALEWCVWKIDTEFYPTVQDLESEAWWQDAVQTGKPLYIPVIEPPAYRFSDPLAVAKGFASRPYCVALEVGLRGAGGPLQEVVNYAAENGISMGFFAALGDIHPEDGKPMIFDIANVDLAAARSSSGWGTLTYFREAAPPSRYDQEVPPGVSPSGHDERCELDQYSAMGYSWAICDITSRSAPLFAQQVHVQPPQPKDAPWCEARLAQALAESERM